MNPILPSNQQVSPPLRPGLSRSACERYIPTIRWILSKWPELSKFETAPLSTATFAGRLRDAIRSLHDYRWSGLLDSVEEQKFLSVYADLAVGDRQGFVIAGPRDLFKAQDTFVAGLASATSTPLVLTDPSEAELRSVALLLANRRLPATILPIHVTGHCDFDPRLLDNEFDVGVTKNPDDTYTII